MVGLDGLLDLRGLFKFNKCASSSCLYNGKYLLLSKGIL